MFLMMGLPLYKNLAKMQLMNVKNVGAFIHAVDTGIYGMLKSCWANHFLAGQVYFASSLPCGQVGYFTEFSPLPIVMKRMCQKEENM